MGHQSDELVMMDVVFNKIEEFKVMIILLFLIFCVKKMLWIKGYANDKGLSDL